MTAYYNEHDPYAAQWLRNLIAAGQIAPGIVDERSIEDVLPSDLRGFTQCHFFAGIGVWSYALRRAGWADDRPVWSGSCPCQPFSAAGQGAAFDDERHLWPAFHHLIQECKPAIVVGEQVASKDADPWIDLVSADVEALGYTFGAIPFPSAGVGAPHIRDRLYWVAHANHGRRIRGRAGKTSNGGVSSRLQLERLCDAVGLADTRHDHAARQGQAAHPGQPQAIGPADQSGGCGGAPGRLGDADGSRICGQPGAGDSAQGGTGHRAHQHDAGAAGRHGGLAHGHGSGLVALSGSGLRADAEHDTESHGGAGEWSRTPHSFWSAADWLLCRDGRWRPVEPGTFPLAHGTPKGLGRSRADWHTPAGEEGQGHRAGRLKGYGNAINAEAARVFVECVMEVCPWLTS